MESNVKNIPSSKQNENKMPGGEMMEGEVKKYVTVQEAQKMGILTAIGGFVLATSLMHIYKVNPLQIQNLALKIEVEDLQTAKRALEAELA
jgi:hypothetical protein